jgi:hypothetical protein
MERQRGPDRPTVNSLAHFATVYPCRLQRHWVHWVSATSVSGLLSDGGSSFSARVLATDYRCNDRLDELVVDRQIPDISSIPGYCDARHDVPGRSPPKRLRPDAADLKPSGDWNGAGVSGQCEELLAELGCRPRGDSPEPARIGRIRWLIDGRFVVRSSRIAIAPGAARASSVPSQPMGTARR